MSDKATFVADLLGERSPEELEEAVAGWVRLREAVEECTCAHDPDGRCWFHTDEAQQKANRVASFIEEVFPEGA